MNGFRVAIFFAVVLTAIAAPAHSQTAEERTLFGGVATDADLPSRRQRSW